ncbi:unnamed protein product [Mytilus coruscus]|uniref:Tesmin/TSO1-like CXC domain-containing protein n=1 Tax=Mytilus coruscus TaxID=42192 RepID=A0A6J8A761_MYTCO|nr:unnamed protein product [Mytilus coruscus]
MAIIQSLDVKRFSSFGDLLTFYLKQLSALFQSASTIVDVFEITDSIKSAEKERRSQAAGGHNEGSSIPDWKKFLANKRNKQALICFIGEFISKFYCASNPLPVGQTLYLAGTFQNLEIDLNSSCKGKDICSRECVCVEQNLCCTELCPCQGSDLSSNILTSQLSPDDDDKEEALQA